jgi:hypothetical protein
MKLAPYPTNARAATAGITTSVKIRCSTARRAIPVAKEGSHVPAVRLGTAAWVAQAGRCVRPNPIVSQTERSATPTATRSSRLVQFATQVTATETTIPESAARGDLASTAPVQASAQIIFFATGGEPEGVNTGSTAGSPVTLCMEMSNAHPGIALSPT